MKYLKKFESLKTPKVGDYCIMRSENGDPKIKNFIDNNIGIITMINNIVIKVVYESLYDKYKIGDILSFHVNQLINFSSTKEELQIILDSKKFNL